MQLKKKKADIKNVKRNKDRRIEKARSLSGRPAEDTGGCREAGEAGSSGQCSRSKKERFWSSQRPKQAKRRTIPDLRTRSEPRDVDAKRRS